MKIDTAAALSGLPLFVVFVSIHVFNKRFAFGECS